MADRRPTFPDRLYRRLLSLFPSEFRGDFGAEMHADFQDQQRDAAGVRQQARLWGRTVAGVLRQAPREHLDLIWRDVVFALRLLRIRPGFTAVAVATLALGIGTNTAVFTLADGMLFKPLPYRDPDGLVLVQGFSRETNQPFTAVNVIDVEQIRMHGQALDDIAFVGNAPALTWLAGSGAEQIRVIEGSSNFLDLLGVVPHLGRALRSDDALTTPRPAMLTFAAWQSRFGADTAVIGRTVRFEEAAVDIVGVLPPDFVYPTQGSLTNGELLLVARPDPERALNPRAIVFSPVARLAPGATVEQAQHEVDLIVERAAEQFPETRQGRALRIANLQYALFELSRPLLWLLVGAASCVLLIACLNLATLMTARGAARAREMGIRQAIGASRARLVRQVVVESLVLGALGGAVALIAASISFDVLRQYVPASYRLVPEALGGRAWLFTAAVSMMSGLLCGVLPAIKLSRPDLDAMMRERGKTYAPGPRVMRAGGPLVAAEVALAMVLFTGTGLMVNSLVRMRTVDLGFNPDGVVSLSLALPRSQQAPPAARYEYAQAVLDRVRRLPGVDAVAAVEYLQAGINALPPRNLGDGLPANAGAWRITPGYFIAMGIPILQGRDLTVDDARTGAAVAVVSASIARHYFPEGSAVGRLLSPEPDDRVTIVGVVADIRDGYGRPVAPALYRPMTPQQPGTTIVARTSGDPALLAAAMREAAQQVEPRAVVTAMPPLDAMLSSGIGRMRFETSLFVLFGVLGVAVAAIGMYGLVAFWVGSRINEMGVRIALGARRGHVRALVLRQSAAPLAAGLTLGLAGSLGLVRRLESVLYDITPYDPATFFGVSAILLGAGLFAAFVPARQAVRVDAISVLRDE